MFEFVTDAVKKASSWASDAVGGASKQSKQSPQQKQQVKGMSYEEGAKAMSPNSQAGAQGAAATANAGGGSWWDRLWGGDESKQHSGGGEAKAKAESGGGGDKRAEGGGQDVDAQRAAQDKFYAQQHRVQCLRSNLASYQRYIQRRDAWDAAYAKHKQNPSKTKAPDPIQPYTPPNPDVIDPTHPAFHAELAEQQARLDKLKGS